MQILKNQTCQNPLVATATDNESITLVRDIATKDGRTISSITVSDMVDAVRVGCLTDDTPFQSIISEVRNTNDKESKQKLKTALPAIIPTAALSPTDKISHGPHYYDKYTGLCAVDIDNLPESRIKALHKTLAEDKHTMVLFTSPSGNGLKLFIRVNGHDRLLKEKPNASYKSHIYSSVEAYYKQTHCITIDPSCKNINRYCYLSYDPDVIYNKNAEPLPLQPVWVSENKPTRKSAQSSNCKKAAVSRIKHLLHISPDNVGEHVEWIAFCGGISNYLQSCGLSPDEVLEILTEKWQSPDDLKQLKHLTNDRRDTPLSRSESIIEKLNLPSWKGYKDKYLVTLSPGDWVFDASTDSIININSLSPRKRPAFNQEFINHYKYEVFDEKVIQIKPSDYVLERCSKVMGVQYAPKQPSPTFKGKNGEEYLNSYRPVEYDEKPTPSEVKDAHHHIVQHMHHLLNDEQEEAILMNYLAWVVQNPGELKNWMVILCGVQGDGKSWFYSLLAAALGEDNVEVLNSQSLEDKFCNPSYGKCVRFIEELKLDNNRKYETLGRMKAYIGNKRVPLREMYSAPRDGDATTNFIAATNHPDCLPIDDNERRFTVLTSQWLNRKQSLREWAEKNPNYYRELYDKIKSKPAAYRAALLNYEVSETFLNTHEAPRTKGTLKMIEEAIPADAMLIRDVIDESDDELMSESVVCVKVLKAALNTRKKDEPDLRVPNDKIIGRYLVTLGYTKKEQTILRNEAGKRIKLTLYMREGVNWEVTSKELNEAMVEVG